METFRLFKHLKTITKSLSKSPFEVQIRLLMNLQSSIVPTDE